MPSTSANEEVADVVGEVVMAVVPLSFSVNSVLVVVNWNFLPGTGTQLVDVKLFPKIPPTAALAEHDEADTSDGLPKLVEQLVST